MSTVALPRGPLAVGSAAWPGRPHLFYAEAWPAWTPSWPASRWSTPPLLTRSLAGEEPNDYDAGRGYRGHDYEEEGAPGNPPGVPAQGPAPRLA